MIVISNTPVQTAEQCLTFDEFKQAATSDKGFDVTDSLYFNINDLTENFYNILKENQEVKFFTLNGNIPDFCTSTVENWGEKLEGQTNNEINTETREVDEITKTQISSLIEDAAMANDEKEFKDAKIYVFGSSKGGSGKTFTALISAYRYAKTHPHERICVLDFDIVDGQIGISIHYTQPTMRDFLTSYQKGYKDFDTMRRYCVKGPKKFPQNVDFYLAPNSSETISNPNFWIHILQNCCQNYDAVVIDTGIDYMHILPIVYAYKAADKIILTTTTSIKSVNSVTKQILKLKGLNENPVYKTEDQLGNRLNVVITQMSNDNPLNETIYNSIAKVANIIATFGTITNSVNEAEFYGQWDVFDNNALINKALDDIMS